MKFIEEDEKIFILFYNYGRTMDTTTPDKDKLIKIIKALLHTDEDLNFLFQLNKKDLEKLASIVRARIGG